MRLFTIGHSNNTTEEFVERLRRNGIAGVVDVRSKPFSRHYPHFNRYVLAEDLQKLGIPYVWMGHSLGGMPEDPSLLTQGSPDYDKIRSSVLYREGIQELLRGLEANANFGEMTLMCSEADPAGCHRRRLVGRDLVEQGIDLSHVLKDGGVVSEYEVREKLGENERSALEFFSS